MQLPHHKSNLTSKEIGASNLSESYNFAQLDKMDLLVQRECITIFGTWNLKTTRFGSEKRHKVFIDHSKNIHHILKFPDLKLEYQLKKVNH